MITSLLACVVTLVFALLSSQVDSFTPRPILQKYPSHYLRVQKSTITTTLSSARASPSLIDNTNTPATIQILMSDTGGGHRASANALRDAFDVLYPGKIEVDIVDLYTDYGRFWPYNSYVEIYKIMATYTFLWKWFFEFGSTPFGLWLNDFLLELFCFDSFKECLSRPSGSTDKRADMVVSVHPLCQDTPLKILAYLDSKGKSRNVKMRTTPFVTVVTDLGGAHPTWFNPGVDKCFVPSDVLYQAALDRNVQPSQIVEYGLPIRKGFWGNEGNAQTQSRETNNKPWFADLSSFLPSLGKKEQTDVSSSQAEPTTQAEKTKLRAQLELEQCPTVLVVGGGDGMGGIVDQALSLGQCLAEDASKNNGKYQMVVVCGKNEAAKKSLGAVSWNEGVNVNVQGFVYNMEDWMRASDVMVTKAGPGTIAEASICGLPCMLSNFLPGQEEGNVPYVKNAGFGSYSSNPKVIAETVSSWLSSPEKLQEMREAALKTARPSATLDIAKDLAAMVFDAKGGQQSK